MDAPRRRVLRCAEQGDWEDALALLADNKALAKAQDDFGMLPLHWACTEPSILIDVLKALIEAFPEGCEIENLSGMLPLHVAIKSKLPGLHINALLQTYAEAALIKDGCGRYPIESAMENNLPKYTLDLIRKAGQRAMRTTSRLERMPSFDLMSTTGSVDDEDSDSKDPLMKARSIGTLLDSRRATHYSRFIDSQLSSISPMESTEISTQLKDLLSQLQQLSVDIRSSASSSTASTYRSSFSSSSSSGQPEVHSILWNPKDKLGVVLEPLNNDTGARIKRFGSKSCALGVENLNVGDILVSINGTSVTASSYSSITRFMKNAKSTFTLCFSKPGNFSFASDSSSTSNQEQEAALYAKVADLLDTTMKKVSAVEETVRLSTAMSFCA
ncbi:hypothetical protein PINS_up013347 [Pythium insidiosum]|nr:hypothetical protein PINS_up013347 [Pythium insidiosum]